MKTVAQRYHETLSQARRCKPRSKRYIVLNRRTSDLFLQQLNIEIKEDKKKARTT